MLAFFCPQLLQKELVYMYRNLPIFLVVMSAIYFVGWENLEFPKRTNLINLEKFINPSVLFDIFCFAISHLAVISIIFIFANLLAEYPKRLFPKYRHISYISILFLTLLLPIGYAKEFYPRLEISKIFIDDIYLTYSLIATTLIAIASFTYIFFFVKSQEYLKAALLALSGLVVFYPLLHEIMIPNAATTSAGKQQNIIIIGLDSVSNSHVKQNIDSLPTFKYLLESGISFDEAYTPIARTFPAWNAILTGHYPSRSSARFNLTPFESTALNNNLVRDFKKQGYKTVFAQDERRFNNINESYGFDQIVGPKLGASDFIIPALADNLISSYFIRTPIGELLFPNLYNNRVSAETYSPEVFSKDISEVIKTTEEPLFLIAHHCLAHFPYQWRDKRPTNEFTEEAYHTVSLRMLDNQVKVIIDSLKQTEKWDNTTIVLLSDHGEGLGLEHDSWITPTSDEDLNLLGYMRGHGNNIFSKDQNNIILHISTPSMRVENQRILDSELASLVDLRPTLQNLFGLEKTHSDGYDLISEQSSRADRVIFMETGVRMSLPTIDGRTLETEERMKILADSYYTSGDGLLTMSDSFFKVQSQNKQLGVMSRDMFLISNPTPKALVLINKSDGAWNKLQPETDTSPEIRNLFENLSCYRSGLTGCYKNNNNELQQPFELNKGVTWQH